MADFRVETGDWSRLSQAASAVRTAVFVEEQGISPELEWDPFDASCLHCVIWNKGAPIATGRLLPDAQIGRMAVLKDWRRTGLGSRVLSALIAAAANRGDAVLRLSAQVPVRGFYERHGFIAEGEVYEEVGIPHQSMRRVIGR